MSSEKLKAQWIARFKRAIDGFSDGGWNYTGLSITEAEAEFKESGSKLYCIETKIWVSEEKQGKGTKRKKHPGCMFRLMEK